MQVVNPRAIPLPWRAGLAVTVALGRWLFSRDRIVYHLHPDEAGNLAMARWISGGTRWNLFDHSTWRPGLATITAPIYWITDDPTNVFRGVLIVNAVLAGVAAVVLASLALRLTNLSPAGCVLAAGAVALAPPSLSATANAWAEALVTLTFLGTLWFLMSFYERPRLLTGCAALAVAAAGFTSHGRLLPLVPLTTVLTVALMLWRRAWWQAGVLAVFAVATFAASSAWADHVFSHVWDSPADANTVGDTLERLKKPLEVVEAAIGQTWYQLVATVGLFGIGTIVTARAALRRGAGGSDGEPPSPVDARLVLALTVPLVGVSWVFMSDRTRSDHLVYGRYTDAIIWPVLIVAIGWLVGLRHAAVRRDTPWIVTSVAAAALATAGAVFAFHEAAFAESVGVRPMIAGFMPWLGGRNAIPVFVLTGLSLIALAVLLALARWPGPRSVALICVIGVALSVAGFRTHHALALRLNIWASASAVTAIEDIVPPGVPLGFRFVRDADNPAASWDDQRRRGQLYQMYLPDREFVRDRGVDDGVGPYVFAPVGDPELAEAGAEVLWTDPRVRIALWREPAGGSTVGADG